MAYFDRKNFKTLDRNVPFRERLNLPSFVLPKIGIPVTGIGMLGRLPHEILDHILSYLDITTLDYVKAVNRRMFELVNVHPHFRIINERAQHTLRCLRALRNAHAITLGELFEKLRTSQCDDCDDFGSYIYLITFRRVCCRCFQEKDRYVPMREFSVMRRFGLPLETLSTLPRVQSYPGSYGGGSGRPDHYQDYTTVIDREAAYHAGIALHGSHAAMLEYVAAVDCDIWREHKRQIDQHDKNLAAERAVKRAKRKANERAYLKKRNTHKKKVLARRKQRERKREMTTAESQIEDGDDSNDTSNESISTFVPESDTDEHAVNDGDDTDGSDDVETKKEDEQRTFRLGFRRESRDWEIEDWESEDRFALRPGNPLRYVAVARVPWLNKETGMDEWGFRCIGCQDNMQWPNHNERDFIMSTFRVHLEECGAIKDGVHHKDGCCQKGVCKARRGKSNNEPYWRL
ncbi:hypothetical protein QQZ08_001891 [Neonectria magnoliae]|uniref:F-box domain-containing protein n=1 Tax=Neonectria magnoliae TaxID=2732573 RepID=A0ABR1IFY0_9HYPO